MSSEGSSKAASFAAEPAAHADSASQAELTPNGGKGTQPSTSLAAQFEAQNLLDQPPTTAAVVREAVAFNLGDIVSVAPRSSGVGCGLEGGMARIMVVHDPSTSSISSGSSARHTYDIKYVLGGKERNVPAERLSAQSVDGSKASESTRNPVGEGSTYPARSSDHGTSRRPRDANLAPEPMKEDDATESDDDDDDNVVELPSQKAWLTGAAGASTSTSEEVKPVKKRRGRPPKDATNAAIKVDAERGSPSEPNKLAPDDLSPIKKRRGRPPKDATNAAIDVDAKGGAASESSDSNLDKNLTPAKKRRGRPPKYATNSGINFDAERGVASDSSSSNLDDLSQVKKRRGRPPKDAVQSASTTDSVRLGTSEPYSSAPENLSQVKKKRGRPPKDAANDVINVDADEGTASESSKSSLDSDPMPVQKKRGRPPKGPSINHPGSGGGRGRGGKGNRGGRGRGAGSRSKPAKPNNKATTDRSGDTTSSDEDSDATDDVESDSAPESESENETEYDVLEIDESQSSGSDGRVTTKKAMKGSTSKETAKKLDRSSSSSGGSTNKGEKKSGNKASNQFLANFVAKKATNGVRREWCDMCRGKSEGYGTMVSELCRPLVVNIMILIKLRFRIKFTL